MSQQDNSDTAVSGSRKRKIKDIFHINKSRDPDDVPTYAKKPRMNEFQFDHIPGFASESLTKASDLDIIWEILINNFDGIPLWTGWNSKRVKPSQKGHQQVRYMKPIPFPPTRIDVIKEVMAKSEEVRIECGEMVLPVCFDLAIAKIALQIQSQEAPEYDRLFILFGQFHIELNVFSVLGKLIEGSGGPCILSEAGVVAAGSITKFLKGKMYNRCHRGHILLATAIRGIQFEQYVKMQNVSSSKLQKLKEWSESENAPLCTELSTLITKYQVFTW